MPAAAGVRRADPAGRVLIGEQELHKLPEAVPGRPITQLGYPAQIFAGSIADNLFLGLKHRPAEPSQGDGATERDSLDRHEALRSGNSPFDIRAEWIDYAAFGLSGPGDMVGAAVRAQQVVARTELPGKVTMMNLANLLGVMPDEIDPLLVAWLRADLVPGTAAVRSDRRVQVTIGDVAGAFAAPASYDVALLDVDNGPDFLVHERNATVYQDAVLSAAGRALRRGGVLGVWSAAPSATRCTCRWAPPTSRRCWRGRRRFRAAASVTVSKSRARRSRPTRPPRRRCWPARQPRRKATSTAWACCCSTC